jgi:hypothetical protein
MGDTNTPSSREHSFVARVTLNTHMLLTFGFLLLGFFLRGFRLSAFSLALFSLL